MWHESLDVVSRRDVHRDGGDVVVDVVGGIMKTRVNITGVERLQEGQGVVLVETVIKWRVTLCCCPPGPAWGAKDERPARR